MSSTLYLRILGFNSHATFTRLLLARGSGVTGYTVNTTNGGNQIPWTKTGGGSAAEWISPPVPAGGFTLSGQITFNIWGAENVAATNCKMSARVFRRAPDNTETEVSGGPFAMPAELGTANTANNWTGTPSAGLAFSENDRLVVRFYADAAGTMAAGTAFINLNGTTGGANGDSYITITENVTWKTDTNTRTIKTSGGDYSTITSWEAANQDDLVANNIIAQAECYAGAFTDGAIVFSGWTTGANNYVRIYTPISERHNGRSRDLTGIGCQFKTTTTWININEDYVRIDGLEIETSNGACIGATSGLTAGANHLIVENTIAIVTGGSSSAFGFGLADTILTMRNCIGIAYNSAHGIQAYDIADLTMENCLGWSSTNNGIRVGPGTGDTHRMWNCYAYSGTTGALSINPNTGTMIGGYNATDDATADDVLSTGAVINVDPANQFVSTTLEDFHLKSGNSLAGVGTPLVSVPTDIMGRPRSSTAPSIGPFEKVYAYDLVGVGPAPGGWRTDFQTLDAWEVYLTNIATLTQHQTAALLNENFAPAGGLAFAGFTTATGARMIIRAATADETGGLSAKHNGLAGTGARITKTNGGFFGVIHINDVNIKHFEVHDVELYGNGTGNIGIQPATAYDDAMISGCLVHDVGETGISLGNASGSGTVRVWNCLLWNVSSLSAAGGITGVSTAADRVEAYNCTVIKNDTDADNGATGIRYCIAKNCISMHWGPTSGHADFLNTGTGSNYNASSDASSPGANSLDNIIAADHFISVGGTWNLHLKPNSTLVGAGTPLAQVTNDIDGQARDLSTPDIGADEFQATGRSSTANMMFSLRRRSIRRWI